MFDAVQHQTSLKGASDDNICRPNVCNNRMLDVTVCSDAQNVRLLIDCCVNDETVTELVNQQQLESKTNPEGVEIILECNDDNHVAQMSSAVPRSTDSVWGKTVSDSDRPRRGAEQSDMISEVPGDDGRVNPRQSCPAYGTSEGDEVVSAADAINGPDARTQQDARKREPTEDLTITSKQLQTPRNVNDADRRQQQGVQDETVSGRGHSRPCGRSVNGAAGDTDCNPRLSNFQQLAVVTEVSDDIGCDNELTDIGLEPTSQCELDAAAQQINQNDTALALAQTPDERTTGDSRHHWLQCLRTDMSVCCIADPTVR